MSTSRLSRLCYSLSMVLPPEDVSWIRQIVEYVRFLFDRATQNQVAVEPEALLDQIEDRFGWESRALLPDALEELLRSGIYEGLPFGLSVDAVRKVQRGPDTPVRETQRTIDQLFQRSKVFSTTAEFEKLITFMGRFRDYAPFNNLLVQLQKPTCAYYATERDWLKRFKRTIKETAAPMIILAPMHPVMLVYDVDATEGEPLPQELATLYKASGKPNPKFWSTLTHNCHRYGITVLLTPFSAGKHGYVRRSRSQRRKIVISVERRADFAARTAILCHELAHVLLGHVCGDPDEWWPQRSDLPKAVNEIEAEAATFIVCEQLGIETSSEKFLALKTHGLSEIPAEVSIELIAKTAGQIRQMCTRRLSAPKRRAPKETSDRSLPQQER